MKIIDATMSILYESHLMAADEVVLISIQHKQRVGKALKVKSGRGITVRGVNLDFALTRMRETFREELAGAEAGVYERPDQKVLLQLQHFKRDPATNTLKYFASKSLTIPKLGIDPVLSRIKAAFSRKK
jgi:hypothetical protein